jgi:hypothetical protein
MAIHPIPKLKSYRSGGNGMPTRCPMARIPVPMPRSETTHDQCGTGSLFIDFDWGQGLNPPIAATFDQNRALRLDNSPMRSYRAMCGQTGR